MGDKTTTVTAEQMAETIRLQREEIVKLTNDLRSVKPAMQAEQRRHAKARQAFHAAANELERLRAIVREARQAFADQVDADLDFCCPKLPDGSPDEEQMDETSRPMIEETRALIARIDAALPEEPTDGD